MTTNRGAPTWPVHRKRKWGGRVVAFFLLAGIGAAIVSYLAIGGSWRICESGPGPGGAFVMNFLGIVGFLVMPPLAALCGALAVAAHALLSRSTRLRRFENTVPTLITVAGIIMLIALVVLWIAWGSPPDGYCDKPLG
ncbi:hypothetical protein [Actinomadura rugatobispora]|uniref:Uncharacterized protein n=1 Tax=Actinomadura rugatobispora TaxID=1994 RepID=A0ABW0ZPA9_9ACTN|nr:hypothetical protein GCM10010200_058290 [Actinomadura rugatobispora]